MLIDDLAAAVSYFDELNGSARPCHTSSCTLQRASNKYLFHFVALRIGSVSAETTNCAIFVFHL